MYTLNTSSNLHKCNGIPSIHSALTPTCSFSPYPLPFSSSIQTHPLSLSLCWIFIYLSPLFHPSVSFFPFSFFHPFNNYSPLILFTRKVLLPNKPVPEYNSSSIYLLHSFYTKVVYHWPFTLKTRSLTPFLVFFCSIT